MTEKLSKLRSLDRKQHRPQKCPFQSCFTHRTAQFTQAIPQFPQFTCRHHHGIISRHIRFQQFIQKMSIAWYIPLQIPLLTPHFGVRGGVMVKALRYKPAGRGFDSRCCYWNFSVTKSTGVLSWGKGGRCLRLTTLPPSCAVVMKSGKLNFLEPSGPLQACNGTALTFFTAHFTLSFLLFG
jgi:hypothetical protein